MEIVKGFRPKDCLSQQDEASRWIDHRIIYAIDKTKVFEAYSKQEVDELTKIAENMVSREIELQGVLTIELTKLEEKINQLGKISLLQRNLIEKYEFERAKSLSFKLKKFLGLLKKE
jgi:hypothetical protein